MKVVLSRKGFDSSYGGMPSPILPDGRMISLPIPSRNDAYTLADINHPDIDVEKLVVDLSRERLKPWTTIHLDPDLDRSFSTRLDGWRPALGQSGAAQTHLANNHVGAGDVFLFFGWFREVTIHKGVWKYVNDAPHLHVIFGWLEVDQVLQIVTQREQALAAFPWIANHPHVSSPDWYDNDLNTLYIAREQSMLCSEKNLGGGRFKIYKPILRLTKPGESRTVWHLPAWFTPNKRKPLTYHPNPSRWTPDGDHVILKSAAKGQEFVIDGAEYPELEAWASSIVKDGTDEAS